MSETQDIQWKRLFVEAITIIASILLAFAIDAWWEERSDRIRLTAAIQNIAAEVGDAREEIEKAVQRNQGRIDGMRQFLLLSPDELLTLDEDAIQSIGEAFLTPSPFDTSGFALQGFLTGGSMELIANDALADALITWAQFPNEIERDYAESIRLFMVLLDRIAKHSVYTSIINVYSDHEVPGAIPLRDALVSFRRDTEAVEAVAQVLLYFDDFNSQLSEGVDYADQVLKASQR